MPRFVTAATNRSIVFVGPWLLGQVVIPSGVLDVRIFRVRRLPRPAIGPAVAIAARFEAQSFRVKHLPAAVAALLKEATMPDDEPAAPSQILADVEEDDATAVQVDPTVEPPAAEAEADAAPPLRASAPTVAAEARRDAQAHTR
ncbi:MAG: hypothetical protein IPK66_15460 [Rhodospirillales bacterium]|nr:hypothetical protein [Rhodospirillales bacterium]